MIFILLEFQYNHIQKNITTVMASRLKQSNLTGLSASKNKSQEKSLEEQVYEMPIENIEA